MKRIYKIFALLMSMALTLSLLAGCADKAQEETATPLVQKLNAADYAAAYELAETDGEKNLVRSENVFAYICSYLNAAFEYAGYEEFNIEVFDGWVNNTSVSNAFLLKVRITLEDETEDFYCYYSFSKEAKDWTSDELLEAEYVENFDNLDTSELAPSEYTAYMTADWIVSGTVGSKIPDTSVERLNKLIDNGKINDITFDSALIESLSEELPINTEFE